MGSYIYPYADCPFYHKEDAHRVYCEGVEEGTSLHLAFGSTTDCKDYKEARCRSAYKKCRIYRMLMAIYEEGV